MTISVQTKIWWMDQQPPEYFMQKNPPITEDFTNFIWNIPDNELFAIVEKIINDE